MSARPVNEGYVLKTPEGSRPFDATAIESDLRSMWKRAGGASPASAGGSAVAGAATNAGAIYRAALSNLIVPLDPGLAAKLSPVLVDVTRMHPSRLFTIEAGAAPKGSRLRARVGALCHLRESGGGSVCSEQIMIDSDAESTSLIPSAVRSLLVGDLPVVLLDFLPGLGPPWVSELMEMADLVLEDSCLRGPGKEPEVWRFLEREGSRKVHDLAWARLTPWRTVLAEVFDDKECLPALGAIRNVEIGYTGEGAPPPPVWLLAGWLASRLGWKPEGGDPNGLTLRSGSGTVTLVLRGQRSGEGHRLQTVRIRADESHPFDVEIMHRGRDETARITSRGPRPSSVDVPFAYCELAACIVGEIHRHAANPSLEDAARAAEALMRSGSRR